MTHAASEDRQRLREIRHILEIGELLSAVLTPEEQTEFHYRQIAESDHARPHTYHYQPLTLSHRDRKINETEKEGDL